MDPEQPLDMTTPNVPPHAAAYVADDIEEQPTRQLSRLSGKSWTLARPRGLWQQATPRMRLVALVAAVALASLVAVLIAHAIPPDVQTATAAQGSIAVSFPAPGTVQSASYDVNFAVQGTVAEIDVRVGQQVSAGQTLAKLDTTLAKDALASAQAQVQAAQSAVASAQAEQSRAQGQVNAAVAQEQTALAQCRSGDTACQTQAQNASAIAQGQASAQIAQATSALSLAQSQLAVAQANVKVAQDNLAAATLTAPHAGAVSQILGTVGSAAGPGSGGAFIRVADLGSLQLAAQVSAGDIGSVQPQQKVRFTVSAFKGRTFLGMVDTVAPEGQQVNGVTRYPVTILVDMNSLSGAQLLPGMPAVATITTYSRIGVVLVPASAVSFALAAANPAHGGFLTPSQVQRALQQARQMQLDFQNTGKADPTDPPSASYLVRRVADRWVLAPVLLGQSDGNMVEVLSAGMPGSLKAGDSVVTAWHGGPVNAPTPTPTPAVH